MASEKKCTPCAEGTMPIKVDVAQKRLEKIPGWEIALDGRAIRRRFNFDNFVKALDFVTKVGEVAEREGHHPDFMLGWGYAECVLWTHSIAGLHENDFIMAAEINALQ